MIRFSNGQEAMFFAASGALGFDGRGWWHERLLSKISKKLLDPSLFWAVGKTLTPSLRKGNGWFKAQPIIDWTTFRIVGWVNALGMPNDGCAVWFLEHMRDGLRNFVLSVASVNGDAKKRFLDWEIMMASIAAWCDGLHIDLAALELNLSCPNTEHGKLPDVNEVVEFCRAAKARIKIPLIVKLSVAQDYCEIARRLEKEKLVEAISINSVPWRLVFPDRVSPFAKFGGGGVSGKIAQDHTWDMVRKLSEASSIPVIAPSIWNYEDIDHVMQLGAQAVHFGSVFMASPWFPTRAVRRWNEEQKLFVHSDHADKDPVGRGITIQRWLEKGPQLTEEVGKVFRAIKK
ncbi:MAG: nitronate monooxygenase [Candidatus Niyogibacteria bacterium]|nr:nitronate monooxygenase [Candidatus Niyogibacteria bacterium]